MEKYKNEIKIFHLIDGAEQATGLTVIIDVFRAFSLECYLLDYGVSAIRPVGSIEDAFRLHDENPGSVLIGERKGIKCEGFDFGNSPSSMTEKDVGGRLAIHTTSAGTQGVVHARNASEIIGGSLVNAKAIAAYIMEKQPESVSLVCMGLGGDRLAAEDELCAEYIKSLLEGCPMADIEQRVADLQFHGGEKFFKPENKDVFPEQDFWLCTKLNRFDFVVQITKDEKGFLSKKYTVSVIE